MLLQTARFLIKCLGLAKKGKPLPGLTDYLREVHSAMVPPHARTAEELCSHDFLLSLFRYRALVAVIDASAALDASVDKVRDCEWKKKKCTYVCLCSVLFFFACCCVYCAVLCCVVLCCVVSGI